MSILPLLIRHKTCERVLIEDGVCHVTSWDWERRVASAKELSPTGSTHRRFVEAGLREPSKSPLVAAVGGMSLSAVEWVAGWRRRLAA